MMPFCRKATRALRNNPKSLAFLDDEEDIYTVSDQGAVSMKKDVVLVTFPFSDLQEAS